MFIIINYDIDEKRCVKVMKLCRKYLHHLQESVFVGELTDQQYRSLREALNKIIVPKEDCVIVYQMPSIKTFKVETLGSQYWIRTVI